MRAEATNNDKTDLNTCWTPRDEADQLAFSDPLQRLVNLLVIYQHEQLIDGTEAPSGQDTGGLGTKNS